MRTNGGPSDAERDYNDMRRFQGEVIRLTHENLRMKEVVEAARGMLPHLPDLPGCKYEHPEAANRLRAALAALGDDP